MIAGPAMAADMPIKAPPPPPVAYYDWTGAYIGFNVGEVWNETTRHFPTPGGVNPDFKTNNTDGISAFTQVLNGSGARGSAQKRR